MTKYAKAILAITALGVIGVNAKDDCVAISQSVVIGISEDKSQLLEIVSKEIAAAPNCACEIVKSAIKASKADNMTVAAIVGAAVAAAPDRMRLISQCAIAVAPDAAAEIQAVLAKLDPNSGDTEASSKSSKSAKDPEVAEEDWNPLDFPGGRDPNIGNIGPRDLPPGFPIFFPPIIVPPVVTNPGP
jgi:hypothetical protein